MKFCKAIILYIRQYKHRSKDRLNVVQTERRVKDVSSPLQLCQYIEEQSEYGKLISIFIYWIIFIASPLAINYIMPFLLLHMTERSAYVLIVSGIIASTELFWCGFMTLVYNSQWQVFQQDRVDPKRLWPWQEDRAKWQKQLRRSIATTAFNVLIFAPINLAIQAQLDFRVVMDPNLAPFLTGLLPQILLMMLIEDFIFFTFHRLLHTPTLYKYHKVHHEFNTTVSIAGLHFHVVEFFLIQSVSFLINMRLVCFYGPIHISTIVSWFILRIWDANIAHSGYNFSWAPLQLLPFCANDEFHDFHHTTNSGNYGSHFRFWDTLFGTNKEFIKYKAQGVTLREEKID